MTHSTGPVLAVRDLSVGFRTAEGVVRAVRGVSFDLARGEVLGVVGESGCGKTVAALALLGLLPDSALVTGSARYRGAELLGRSDAELAAVRGDGVAMVFQDPMTSLNPVHTVGAQLAEAHRAHRPVTRRAAAVRAVEALDLVGMPQPELRARQYPHELSGGLRQRAMIAMAMINEPDVLIADEPTTALDVTVQAQLLRTLHELRRSTGVAILLISHDLGVIAGMADRVQVMYAGTVVETGPVDAVYDTPRMPYTVGLLGSAPNPAGSGRRLVPIGGAPPSPLALPAGCAFGPRCPLVTNECVAAEPALIPTERPHHHTRCRLWRRLAAHAAPTTMFPRRAIRATVPERVDSAPTVRFVAVDGFGR